MANITALARPSGLRVERPENLPETAWDALVSPGQGPLRSGFVDAWCRVELPALRSLPLVVREDGEAVVAGHGYVFDFDMALGADSRLARRIELLRRVAPRVLVSKVFELGSPTPIVNPFLVGEDASAAAIDALVAGAVAAGEEAGAALSIVQNFETGAFRDAIATSLRAHGFAPIPVEPTVVLPLPFASFDDYRNSMRAQYRRRMHKVFERSAHLEVELLQRFDDIADELAHLWRRVWDRAKELKREILTPAFFRAASDLEDVSVLALRRPDGSLACYALLLADSPWLHFLYTGFERSAGEREGAYFRLLYEIVRCAIDQGFTTVNLGMTTIEPKLDAGGVIVPLTAWIRHRRASVQWLEVLLARKLFAPADVAPRRVFKEPELVR